MYNSIDNRKTEYDVKDFERIKKYFNSYVRILRNNKRLLLALDRTFRACTTDSWKVSFIMFTNSLEAILTYSRDPGVTKRLSKLYACFISEKNLIKDKLYKEFYNLYNLRSEIIHGAYKRKRSKNNLKNLSRVSDLVRSIWRKILLDKTFLLEFEKDDKHREIFLKSFMGIILHPKLHCCLRSN